MWNLSIPNIQNLHLIERSFIIQSLAQQQQIMRPRQKCYAPQHFLIMPSVTLIKFLHVPKLTCRNAHLWIAFFLVFRQSSYYAVFTEPTLRPSFPPFSIYRFRPDCYRNEILSRSNCAQVESVAIIILLWLATNRLKILDNVFDTVTKCLHRGFWYGYRH